MQLLRDRVGDLLVALGVHEQQRGARPEPPDGLVEVERLEPRLDRLAVDLELDQPPGAQAAQQEVLGRGADRDHRGRLAASRAAAWIATKPPMLEPRRAIAGASSASSSHIDTASSIALGPNLPSDRPWPRWSNASAAKPWARAARAVVEVVLLRRARAVQDHDARRRLALGVNSAYDRPLCVPSRGGSGASWIIGLMAATTLSQVYPLGSRLNEAGRLEVGGCDVIELAKEFGTPAYVYAEDDMRARAREFQEAFAARTERFEVDLREQGVPVHRGLPAVRRGGALVRRRQRGGELHLALRGGFDAERIYMHGNNKTEEELAYARRERRRHDRARLLRRDRARSSGSRRASG